MSLIYDLGFLGGGQLARMSIMAAQRIGLSCISLDPGENTPAGQIAPCLRGKLDNPEAVAHLMNMARRITLENEFIPAQTIKQAIIIAGRDESCLTPGVATLATIQDKLLQREAYQRFGAPSPTAVPIENAIAEIGFPMVLKARFGGYDGKGTRYARTQEEFDSHHDLISQGGWMAEQFVPFKRELAVMVYRSKTQTGCFPTMETVQVNHVCDQVFPAHTDASAAAIAAVESVQGFGLFGVELFELENGEILINEIAPRPHNTGHYSLDWGGISQFEHHVRLAMGFTCDEPQGTETCMVNLLGLENPTNIDNARTALYHAHPEARLHWYGKSESRPGRKMGHINVSGPNCRERALAARETFYDAWS
jgi:5-(carboxyamino)imidazole ribonucleotide synthase